MRMLDPRERRILVHLLSESSTAATLEAVPPVALAVQQQAGAREWLNR
jgi:hypothetical protein